jgi:hypothetical protein
MAELQAQVAAEHGPDARIIAADKVTVGGIRGFFAREHFEVTVEVRATDAAARGTRRGRRAHAQLDTQARLGIAALLDDAEAAEARVNGRDARGIGAGAAPAAGAGAGSGSTGPAGAGSAGLSTGSGDFAALMDNLTFNTTRALSQPAPQPVSPLTPPALLESGLQPGLQPGVEQAPPMSWRQTVARGPVVPRPLGGAGDLIVIIGLHDDALTVAESMAAAGTGSSGAPGDVALAGVLAPGYDPAWDRRRALGARARGVERQQSLFIAFGIEWDARPVTSGRRAFYSGAFDGSEARGTAGLRDLAAQADAVRAIGADQLWVAVDAGRKSEDTERWVRALADALEIDAVAVVGGKTTSSPDTVYELSLPVGWVDGDLPLPASAGAPGAPQSQARLV